MPSSVEKSDYAVISSLIKAEDVIKIWTGCPERDLADHCFKKRIPCYLYHHSLQSPDGKIFHYCIPEWGPDDHGIPDVLDWAGIVFEMQDIKKFENEHPEYLWKAVSLDDCPSLFENKDTGNNPNDGRNINEERLISTDPEWMPAHEARVVIGMTPINFVNFLNSGGLETDREQERLDFAKSDGYETDNVPFFKTNDLNTLRVHKASFADCTERLYVGRYMDTTILKYYDNTDQAADNDETGHNKNVVESESTTLDTFMTADDLCKKWSISPTQLVNIIRCHNDLPAYWEESDVPF